MDVEGCGLLDIAWFCVCKLVGSLAGDECKFCGGGASASALGDRRVCVEIA